MNETTEPIRTAAEVAKKIGVSENTYRDMKPKWRERLKKRKKQH